MQPPRELNLLQTSSIIIGAVIGSGVFITIPNVYAFAGSALNSYLIWLVAGLFWIPQILVLAEMGTAYPNQGGPYFFLNKAGFPLLGFLYTWTAFLTSDTPTLTIIALSAISALKIFSPLFGNPYIAKILATFILFGLAYIQIRSVKVGGNFQVILTIFKLLPLITIIIIGIFYIGDGNITKEVTVNDSRGFLFNITSGISATLWAYAGFVNILYMAGEIKNPFKVLPKSLIGSLIFVILAYILISLGTTAIVPGDEILKYQGDFINPFKYLKFFRGFAGEFFAIVFFISMIGVLNSTIMAQPRLEYATAKDGLFFSVFGKLHPKYLTPSNSILIQVSLASLLFLFGNIETLLGYFTLSYVLQNALVYSAIFFLQKKEHYKPTFKVRYVKTLAVISIFTQLYIAVGSFLAFPFEGAMASLGLILSGIPIYIYFRKNFYNQNTESED